MRYLITGGLGFVGSWVTRHLLRAGHEVTVLSRTRSKPQLRDAQRLSYSLLTLDLSAPRKDLAAAFEPLVAKGLDGCVHLAAAANKEEVDYGRIALSSTVLGTRNLLEALQDAAEKTKTAPTPLIYGSTFHVYGRTEGVVDETSPLAPPNEYALTHLLAEEYCRLATRVHGQPTLCLRLTNAYGAPLLRPFGQWQLLLPDLCRMAFREKALSLRSNPCTRRDFVWLGDAAAVVERLLPLLADGPDLAGQTLNLASGIALSIDDIAHAVADVYEQRYGQSIPVIHNVPRTALPELTVRMDRLQNVLGTFSFSNRTAQEISDIFTMLEQD